MMYLAFAFFKPLAIKRPVIPAPMIRTGCVRSIFVVRCVLSMRFDELAVASTSYFIHAVSWMDVISIASRSWTRPEN